MRDYKNHYQALTELFRQKKSCVLATVAETHGSAPQKAGSSAIFGVEGLITGTVGGGVVEGFVHGKAMEGLLNKASGIYRFELNDDMAKENSSICGGGMTILIDASPEKHVEVFELISNALARRVSGVLVTLANHVKEELSLQRLWVTRDNRDKVAKNLSGEVRRKLEEMMDQPTPADFREVVYTSPDTTEKSYAFLESIVPLPRLLIAGAGHLGKAVAHLGRLLDFEVIVWDDRPEFANRNNLPDADLILSGNLKTALKKFTAQQDTFVVIVTRGHKQDSDVLRQFINTEAGYIGMIGSRKKVAQVREQFIKNEWTTAERWSQIHAPIGLDIQSKSVQEIAMSIAAELIWERQKLNRKDG